ncbi:hypothetical protein F4821DRAFT_239461 [Hypoxylon rubiginosum]|uniref:Uncharacterized protein n=1 Tax=Hypoxylon rubiginosum TaxID=110542 RepID=A0ACC0D050_9PEZI|nr:hypothetical protein F4821DRAFT_239461 [Hypoxylon rubiginosum]
MVRPGGSLETAPGDNRVLAFWQLYFRLRLGPSLRECLHSIDRVITKALKTPARSRLRWKSEEVMLKRINVSSWRLLCGTKDPQVIRYEGLNMLLAGRNTTPMLPNRTQQLGL